MKIKLIIIIFLTIVVPLCVLLVLNSCQNREIVRYEIVREAMRFANENRFHNSIGDIDLEFDTLNRRGYTHVIFVHVEEEFLEGDFADDAIVAWPSLYTYLRLDGINNSIVVRRGQIEFEEFSLSHPLTIENMIDDWENVRNLWWSNANMRSEVRNHALLEYFRITELELAILGEALEFAGIDVAEYGFEQDFSLLDLRQIMGELYEMLDRDVQMQIIFKIPNLMAEYRAMQRFDEWWEAGQQ